jgi:multidrug efflux pump
MSWTIRRRIHPLAARGGGHRAVVNFLSLGWRPGIVVALCIPLVLAMTFAGMSWMGIDLQRISLGALIIALGLLVDDAIIVVEAVSTHLEAGWTRTRAAISAYTTTAIPMLVGTLITVAGFLPIAMSKATASEYVISLFQVIACRWCCRGSSR